jgi:hypothetical protein
MNSVYITIDSSVSRHCEYGGSTQYTVSTISIIGYFFHFLKWLEPNIKDTYKKIYKDNQERYWTNKRKQTRSLFMQYIDSQCAASAEEVHEKP